MVPRRAPRAVRRADRWLYAWTLGYVAVGAASLLVPLFAIELGADAFVVGAIAASAAFAGVPGALLWGRLASRTRRRRPFVLVALGATAAVLAVVPLASAPGQVLLANAALWFVVSAAAPVLNLILVEGHPESAWDGRIALLNAYQGYGWVAGLLVGTAWTVAAPVLVPGLTVATTQRALFGLLAASSLVAFGLARLWYPEPTTVSTDRFRRVYRELSREGWGAGRALRTLPYSASRIYWALATLGPGRLSALRRRYGPVLTHYLAAATLFSVGFAVFWGPMPAYLVGVGLGPGAVFALFVAGNLGAAVAFTPVGRLAPRRDPRTLQAASLAARVVLFPVVALVGVALGATVLAACFVLIGVTWAVIAVTATGLVTRLADAPVRGEALGVHAALVGLGTGVGSVLGGATATALGYLPTFVLASAFVLLGAVVVVAGR